MLREAFYPYELVGVVHSGVAQFPWFHFVLFWLFRTALCTAVHIVAGGTPADKFVNMDNPKWQTAHWTWPLYWRSTRRSWVSLWCGLLSKLQRTVSWLVFGLSNKLVRTGVVGDSVIWLKSLCEPPWLCEKYVTLCFWLAWLAFEVGVASAIDPALWCKDSKKNWWSRTHPHPRPYHSKNSG